MDGLVEDVAGVGVEDVAVDEGCAELASGMVSSALKLWRLGFPWAPPMVLPLPLLAEVLPRWQGVGGDPCPCNVLNSYS